MKCQENPISFTNVSSKKRSEPTPDPRSNSAHTTPLGLRNEPASGPWRIQAGAANRIEAGAGACSRSCLAQDFLSVNSNPLSGGISGLLKGRLVALTGDTRSLSSTRASLNTKCPALCSCCREITRVPRGLEEGHGAKKTEPGGRTSSHHLASLQSPHLGLNTRLQLTTCTDRLSPASGDP